MRPELLNTGRCFTRKMCMNVNVTDHNSEFMTITLFLESHAQPIGKVS